MLIKSAGVTYRSIEEGTNKNPARKDIYLVQYVSSAKRPVKGQNIGRTRRMSAKKSRQGEIIIKSRKNNNTFTWHGLAILCQ